MNSSQLIDIVDVVCHSFRHLNPRLMNHGERVAYILMKMLEGTNYYTKGKTGYLYAWPAS